MEQELNLLDYVIPDIKVYSIIHQRNKTILKIEPDSDFPIIVGNKGQKGNKPMRFNRSGSVLKNGKECLLFPSEECQTWEGYVTPIVFYKGEIVKAYDSDDKALIRIYSHYDKEKAIHYCFNAYIEKDNIEYLAFDKVDKFRREDGYWYAKAIYSKMNIGIYKKTEQNKQLKDEKE